MPIGTIQGMVRFSVRIHRVCKTCMVGNGPLRIQPGGLSGAAEREKDSGAVEDDVATAVVCAAAASMACFSKPSGSAAEKGE